MRKDAHSAASDIQKVFRGYIARQRAARRREEELIFIGMKPAPGDASRSLRSAFEVRLTAHFIETFLSLSYCFSILVCMYGFLSGMMVALCVWARLGVQKLLVFGYFSRMHSLYLGSSVASAPLVTIVCCVFWCRLHAQRGKRSRRRTRRAT